MLDERCEQHGLTSLGVFAEQVDEDTLLTGSSDGIIR